MTKVTIDREERYTVIKHKDLTADDRSDLDQLIQSRHIPTRECLVIESDWPEYEPAWRMIEDRVTGAATRQPEGDGLEVVESLHVWRATNRFGDTCHFGDAGCARVWAGTGGQVDRIELKPVPELYDVNHADAAEVSATEIKVVAWAHCADATRLLCDLGKQRSVPGHYADEFTIPLCRLSDAQRAIAERDATIERLEAGIPRIQEQSHQIRQQRDKLAGLLREVRVIVAREVERWTRAAAILPVNANVESGLLTRIDAALAEVKS